MRAPVYGSWIQSMGDVLMLWSSECFYPSLEAYKRSHTQSAFPTGPSANECDKRGDEIPRVERQVRALPFASPSSF
ncbi:Uncharacterized protein HZ326_26875 [Fusarium oxysporum f. sp. albedinis]|nr:Uncharacterized protein HZ326_26875 [Fusarium oxysporum f. sp. albedinis]